MKTRLGSQTKTEAVDRDTIIGSAVSNAMANVSPVSPCPTAETLAVLIDCNASEDERETFLGHMAVCDRCREIYLLAHDLSSDEPAKPGYRGWYVAGGTLAAVALVVLAVKLTIQEPAVTTQQASKSPLQQSQVGRRSKTITSSSATIAQQEKPQDIAFQTNVVARQLAKAVSSDSLVAAVGASTPGSYGFAGSGSQQAIAFRAGKEIFEVELWIAAGDKERTVLAAERLLPLLRSVEGESATAARLDALLRHIEAGQPEDASRHMETLLQAPTRGIIRLGSWVAAARVAIEAGKDPYFNGNPPNYLLKEQGTRFSPSVREILGKLDKNRPGTDSAEIQRLLTELVNAI